VSSRDRIEPLLAEPGERPALFLGNEGIVRGALEAGVAFASGYPGTPSSEVTDSFARLAPQRGIVFEYSVNEKIAIEMAWAASLAGARSIVAMKHLGLMSAGDPISTIPYVGVVAGMVVVSAGDPSCMTSPNEQDQRHLGAMLHLPTMDPSTPQEALDMTRAAFDISERSRLPVLMRITTRVAHTRAPVRCGALSEPEVGGFVKDAARFNPVPPNARRMRTELPGRLELAREEMALAGLFRRQGQGRVAVIAAGAPAATVAELLRELDLEDEVQLAVLGAVHPLPEPDLVDLLRDVDTALVVEELSPFLEDQLLALSARRGLTCTVLGKRSGHLPEYFEYGPAVIQAGLHDALGLGSPPDEAAPAEPLPMRPPVLCSSCPHRTSYFAVRMAFDEDQLFFNDIGCYSLGLAAPLETSDALLCMGAGFTLAHGVSRVTGKRTVGFLGDSTFFHSGMPALLDAIQQRANMVAVILDNQVTAMTGFQESPTTVSSGESPVPRADIEGVVRALGATQVEKIDGKDLGKAIAAFQRARHATGVSVVIAEEPCPVHQARLPGHPAAQEPYRIDQERCRHCGRADEGMRCGQDVSKGLERHMARVRTLERAPGDDSQGSCGAIAPGAVAPCVKECPLGLCIQGYAGHVAAGRPAEALELIMERCPLPDSICRVCHRPCEDACVHRESGGAVAINDLKRFVMDWAAEQDDLSYDPTREPDSGRRVAIVGAGPAGLAAAHDLRLRGHAVDLYDAAPKPGGLLRSGVPGFRLPAEALDRDVERILSLGVRFEGGRRLGDDLSLAALLEDGHDAVFLALGASRPLRLAIDGLDDEGAPRLDEALAYIDARLTGEPHETGRRVLVIGGGNAAMDAARVALRCGAESVVALFPESREQMAALEDEVAGATAEGLHLAPGLRPQRAVGGPKPGLHCRPEDGGDEIFFEADQLIVAIGQAPDPEVLAPSDPKLERGADGCLVVDEDSAVTSDPRVFAGGDLVAGARTVTSSVAQGQRAAWGIDRLLRGPEAADKRMPPPRTGGWTTRPGEPDRSELIRLDASPRRHAPELEPTGRIAGFDEVHGVLDEAAARAEGARCSSCGQCGNCRACLDLFGCPAFLVEDGQIRIDQALCTGCGICAAFCPNGAIVQVSTGVEP